MPISPQYSLLAIVILLTGGAFAHGQHDRQGAPAREISPAVREALTKASAVSSGNQFNQLLCSIASELPLIPTRDKDEKFAWSNVALNVAGAGVDAVRFRSSLSEPADMMWAFTPPPNLESWYIISADRRRMIGFRTYATEHDVVLPNVPQSERNLLHLQDLLGGEIQPGREYILWFRFTSPRPANLHLVIRLIGESDRAASRRFAGISQTVAEQVGLDWPFRYETSRFHFRPAEE